MQNFKEVRQRVATRSKEYRKEKGHSQEQATDACGLNFYRMESMEHDPRLNSLVVLANYGSRSMEEMMRKDKVTIAKK